MIAVESTTRVGQRDGSQRWREVFEVAFNARYKAVDFRMIEFQSLNVRESGPVAQATAAECLRREPITGVKCAHSDFLYERHQTLLMQLG